MDARGRGGRGGGRGFTRGRGGRGGGSGRGGGGGRGRDSFDREPERGATFRGMPIEEKTPHERAMERKAARKADRAKAKRDRIRKHETWIEERRGLKAQREQQRAADEERRRVAQKKREYDEMQAAKLRRAANANVEKSSKKQVIFADEVANGSDNLDRKRKRNEGSVVAAKAPVVKKAQEPTRSLPAPAEAAKPKYVPPALRKVNKTALTATRRICNKLTVENVIPLTTEVCELFTSGEHSRKDVIDGFCNNLRATCLETDMNLASTSALSYAALTRGLQLKHGNDLAAPILEAVCRVLENANGNEAEDTACNCTVLLAQFYLMHVVEAPFVTSLLRALFGDAHESVTSASAALALLRVAGERLLKEAPAELNNLVSVAQERYQTVGADAEESTRLGILLQLTRDVAGGRTSTTAAGTSTHSAGVDKAATAAVIERLAQLAPVTERNAKLRIKAVQTINTLNVTWEQVVAVDNKEGLWWARAPPRPSEEEIDDMFAPSKLKRKRRAVADDDGSEEGNNADGGEQMTQSELAAALKRQEMVQQRQEEVAASGMRLTTEARRQIFHCIASAVDDVDCFNMLMGRDPSGAAMLDTASVLLQACFQEKSYNPFYANVIQRILSVSKKAKTSFQFAIWDRFKMIRINGVDMAGYVNFASCVSYLCAEGFFNLALLRGLDLDDTSKTIGLFARVLLLRMLVDMEHRRLVNFFFGADLSKGDSISDAAIDTARMRKILTTFFAKYFVDGDECSRWLPVMFDVVTCGAMYADGGPEQLVKRIETVHRALRDGV